MAAQVKLTRAQIQHAAANKTVAGLERRGKHFYIGPKQVKPREDVAKFLQE